MTDTTAIVLDTIDPRTIATTRNVRKDPNLNAQFVDSIRTHGVRVPVSVYWEPAIDSYQVEDGQRRVLAAVEAGLTSIPAFVIAAPADDAARIVGQLVVNEHRSSISPGEDAGAIADLALFGVSATMIAKRVGRKMKDVSAAVKVAGSPVAAAALQQHQLSIEDAFILTEFEGDEEAIAQLQQVLETRPEQLVHRAQQIRNDRAAEAAKQKVRDEILAAGITLLPTRPDHDSTEIRAVTTLYLDADRKAELTDEIALAEAGEDLRAFVATQYGEWDSETGNRAATTYGIAYAVAHWEAHGWHSYSWANSEPKGPLTTDDEAARAASRANTKLWAAASKVRVAYVRELLKRRALPADYIALTALYLATFPSDYGPRLRGLAAELLSIDASNSTGSASAIRDLLTSSPTQAPHVALAIGIAGLEASWDEKRGWSTSDIKLPLYLRQLKSWGYTLSDIEETIVNPPAVPLIDSITSERAS